MNLMKYLRKNQTRIMVFVVITLMIAFVGGSALQQILMSMGSGINRTVATYRGGGKITELQRIEASNQLDLLRSLKMPVFLQFGARDLGSILAGQLLFPDSQSSAFVNSQLKMMSQQGQFSVTEEQIDEFFISAQKLHSVYYWILLKAEARQAGCIVSKQAAGMHLKRLIPALWSPNGTDPGPSAEQVIAMFINNGTPEDLILTTVADLLSITAYSQLVCSGELVTEKQIKAQAARTGEKISVDYVAFKANDFLKFIENPSMQEVKEHFEKYKDIPAGNPADENPYGFGYKIPARVEFEYLMLTTDEVSKIIPEPTDAEKENYYKNNKNLEEFKYTDNSDPNNPVEKTKDYSEVESQVADNLKKEKINIKINILLSELKNLAEAAFEEIDMETATVEQLRDAARDYAEIAETTGSKYGITVYTGKTGTLSMDDISSKTQIKNLAMQGAGQNPVEISKIIFSVDGLEVTTLGRFDIPKPKLWENIGPFKNQFGGQTTLSGIIRITNIYPAQVADDISFVYDSTGIVTNKTTNSKDTFVLKTEVLEDLKMLRAMKMAEKKAKAFADSITEADWDKAVKAYNDANLKKEASEREKSIRIEELKDKIRKSSTEIKQSMKMVANFPFYANSVYNDKLVSKVYPLLGAGETEAENLKEIVILPETKTAYVIKDISKTNATIQDLQENKARMAFTANRSASEPLAMVFFMPDNIRDRMQFEYAVPDAEDKPASEDTSLSAGDEEDGES